MFHVKHSNLGYTYHIWIADRMEPERRMSVVYKHKIEEKHSLNPLIPEEITKAIQTLTAIEKIAAEKESDFTNKDWWRLHPRAIAREINKHEHHWFEVTQGNIELKYIL